jgi:hypothetical protein
MNTVKDVYITSHHREDPIAPNYYKHFTRTEIKRLFGCKEIPPYFWWDFTKYSTIPYSRLTPDGRETIIGCAVCARLRMDRHKGGDGAHIIPVDKNGEVLVSGTPKEFLWCTARGMARSIEQVLEAAPTTTSQFTKFSGGIYGAGMLWEMVYVSLAAINKIKYPWNAKTLPSEVLVPAYLWMQNYLNWWEKVDV